MTLYELVGHEECDADVALWYYDFLVVSRMKFHNMIFVPTDYRPHLAC